MIGTTKKSAFTLLEVIVSVAIFTVIVLASSQIFQSVISSQVKNFSETALQDDVKYFMEVFVREAEGAIKNTTASPVCGVNAGQTYVLVGDSLYFKNKLGECVIYYVDTDSNGIVRLVLDRGGEPFYLSSDKIDIQNLKFVVVDSVTIQPLLTLNLTVKSKVNPNLPSLNIQTSVSSAWYAN